MKKINSYFSKYELCLWIISAAACVLSFCIFDRENYLILIASLVGVTSLILNAKGNPAGQALMIVFSLLYGIISYGFSYYGEMLTYLCMTMPMAIFALISWMRNPYCGKRSEVKVNTLKKAETAVIFPLTAGVTFIFYFILRYFNTANIFPSTLSVATSFLAVYLTFRRSPLYALAYAANDAVLILLWILASLENTCYISVTVCFAVFLVNDMYGFFNWRRIKRVQSPSGS